MTQTTCTPDYAVRAYLYDNEIKYFKKRRGQQKYIRLMAGARVWLDAVQEFELLRGDAPFGRRKMMTGREARDANRGFEDQFAKHCVAHPERRLWRWRAVDRKAVKEQCKQAALRVGV